METRIVTIDLDARSYDIYIGAGLSYRIADLVPDEIEGRSVFIVADMHLQPLASTIRDVLSSAGAVKAEIYAMKAGEQAKSFEHVENICHWLLENGVGRNSIVFAIGGGVLGDLAGFCASIVLRGIPFIQIPTTLLAQVDSSVGGKTGINTQYGKNLIGSFYQPAAVIADTEILRSLPRRELLAGYAEVVKYGLISDAGFFNWLEENGRDVCKLEQEAVMHAIEVSVRAKAAIVKADEREETGQRALLNLGHTFGHALETATEYDGRLLHGEAVSIGMCMAFDLSSRLGLCPRADYERVESHLIHIGLPVSAAFVDFKGKTSAEKLLDIMRRDKKASNGKMKFIVATGIGQTFLKEDVPEDVVLAVLKNSLGAATQGSKGQWKSAFSSLSS